MVGGVLLDGRCQGDICGLKGIVGVVKYPCAKSKTDVENAG
jgi:hypothetical protein